MNRTRQIDITTIVWLLLVLSTLLSWWVGGSTFNNANVSSVIVLAVAFFKVHLVGNYFMELRHAPWPLRMIFQAWLLIVGVAMIVVYLWQ